MNFLVLTGTTGFSLLENSIVKLAQTNHGIYFVLQTKNTLEVPENVKHVPFVDMRNVELSHYAGIIGHCGAGTTFWALSTDIPFLAVVDLTREDNHQTDLGDWLDANKYAYVVQSRPLSYDDLIFLANAKFNKYIKDEFKIDKINKMF